MLRFVRSFIIALSILVAAPVFAGPVDINTADAAALAQAIKGVGEKKAAAIVAYRNEHGPFQSVDDLTKVPGIGQATVEGSRDQLSVTAK